jgi:small multidrug resistance pump
MAQERVVEGAADPLARYRGWFYAAAVYNLVWGAATAAAPGAYFRLLGLDPPSLLALWQCVGMFVLVYAPAYWWTARAPSRHHHLVILGLLGKVLGPLGFAWAVATGQLPLAFGWTILTNDLLWWPAFVGYLRDAARLRGGWAALIRAD